MSAIMLAVTFLCALWLATCIGYRIGGLLLLWALALIVDRGWAVRAAHEFFVALDELLAHRKEGTR